MIEAFALGIGTVLCIEGCVRYKPYLASLLLLFR